jgi:hypothetical protein
MNQSYKILLIGCLSITLADALGSIASRQFKFNYSHLFFLSLVIYLVVAFIATRKANLKTGILFAAILGFFDATIGWKISMLLNAYTGDVNNHPTTGLWVVTILIVTIYGALVGFIGGGIAKLIARDGKYYNGFSSKET